MKRFYINGFQHFAPTLTAVAGTLLGVAMLLLLRRYTGIVHDATLYLGQGLMQQQPGILAQDLFFLYGSQASYTLFPWLLGQAFNWASPPIIFLVGTLIGLLSFAAAGWYFLRALLPETQRYLAWLGTICLPPMYGMGTIFSFSEPFLTPRIFSEGLCLLAMGLLTRRRWWSAATTLLLALLLHPLQTLAALAMIWIWLTMRDRRWLHALWLTLPILLLAWVGVSPFDSLLRRIDPAWNYLLHKNTGQLFLLAWEKFDYLNLCVDGVLLALAWRLRGNFATWCGAALIGLILGLSTSLLLADTLQLVLPTTLQPWRAHWIAHWMAMAAMASLLYRDVNTADFARALLLALVLLLLLQLHSLLCLPLLGLYAIWPYLLAGSTAQRVRRLLGFLFALCILLLLITHAVREWRTFQQLGYQLAAYPLDRRLIAFPLLALGLPLLGVLIWQRINNLGRWALFLLLACPLTLWSATHWDSRPDLMRSMEQAAGHETIFGAALPRNAQVYWDQGWVTPIWLVLERPSYAGTAQVAGQIFNRMTALDANERFNRMLLLTRESDRCQTASNTATTCQISDLALRQACGHGRYKGPDYLVLPYLQPQRSLGNWTIPSLATNQPPITFYLYSCTQIISDLNRARAP